jgi:mono/diheme cytochrome c family protein
MIKQAILLCLAFAASLAPARAQNQAQTPALNRGPTLTLADRGKFHTFNRDTLLARRDVVEVTIARDPMYGGQTMSYRAVPAAALLKDLAVGADDYVQARATDDFSVSIPARLLTQRAGGNVEAFVAIESATLPWPNLPGANKKGSAGPFAIIWRLKNSASVSGEYWAYHLAALKIVDSPTKRWPQLAIGAEVPAADPIRQGLDRFVAACMACHRFNGAGEGAMGPDLGKPLNPAEWFQPDALKKFIRNPKSLRDWPEAKMAASDPESLPDGDIDAIVAWLTYKARRK